MMLVNERNSTTKLVNLAARPVIITPPADTSVLKRDDLVLQCGWAANPAATVTWITPNRGEVEIVVTVLFT